MAPQDEQAVYWAEHLDDEKQQKLNSLREQLSSNNSLLQGEDSDYDLMRFLKARGWNVQKASQQYLNMVQWRKEQDVDAMLGDNGFSYPELSEVKACYPHFYHKMDKFGRPVYVERLGMLNPSKLLKITSMKRFVTYHIWCWERLKKDKFTACTKLQGRPIFTTCVILDLKDVGLSHFTLQVQRFIRTITKIDSMYYPEHLGQMFIINTPTIFKTMWNVIQPWLDPPTRSKIRVLGKDYLDELQQVIALEDIPDFLGGLSPHPDICVDIGPWMKSRQIDSNSLKDQPSQERDEDSDKL
eukprot:TRINITY_DN827_c0_g2_i1.p1 TRINITY_DN827_c0_g2~~TRINITY_DN827_c0_g2_i1.p1  ORF type:complete len:298 (-),score=30.06 TRINITY_DN827_c0_g2_i1:111-1004(-)